MRKKELARYAERGCLHYIFVNEKVAGFYVLDGTQFKNLFIAPAFRRKGLARKTICDNMKNHITICTTHRHCPIKKLIIALGFTYTGVNVQGKQSELEIWAC